VHPVGSHYTDKVLESKLTQFCDYDGDKGAMISSFATLFQNIRIQCVTFATQPSLCVFNCSFTHSLIQPPRSK